jgi:hypothetical protein
MTDPKICLDMSIKSGKNSPKKFLVQNNFSTSGFWKDVILAMDICESNIFFLTRFFKSGNTYV